MALAAVSSLCTILDARAQLKFNFESGELPPDTSLFGNARFADDGSGANSCLHLTDPINTSFGQFLVANVGNGKNVREIDIRWRSLIGAGTGGGADGYSLNWATDLPATPDYANPGEEGVGSGLTVTVDTFDNGGGEAMGGGAPGIELRWNSNVVAFAPIPKDDPGGGQAFLRRNRFVDAQVTVDAKGLASFTYDNVSITAMLEDWKGIKGGGILLGARTGGGNDRHWIDDLQITTGLFSSGVFNGLFSEAGGIRHDHSGFFNLALNSRGKFSGYVVLAGKRHAIKGVFNLETLLAEVTIVRPGTTTATVELALIDKNTIRGIVSDGVWTAALEADRRVWDKKTNPAERYSGRYTAVLTSASGVSFPNGFGYAMVNVDPAGGVTFAGALGDGTKAAQKVAVSRNGRWPFFVAAYKGQGSILGWITINNAGVRSAGVAWTKKPGVTGPRYPNGFVFAPALIVAPYTPPPRGTRIIDLSTGAVEFGLSDLAAPFVSEFALTPENKVVDLSDHRLSISFATKTGLFKGSVVEPGDGAKVKFTGAVYQPAQAGFGFYLGPTRSGSVIVDD
jgi:hypothetical protein